MNYPYPSICVFCGMASGLNPAYYAAARDMGKLLAEKKITLVFGAGRTGMMGALAQGFMQVGGEIIGLVPRGLESPKLIYTDELTRWELLENIQQRKARMNELADAFIALPGGFGTMDELFEMLTWSQIGLSRKPVALLNVNGYYDELLKWIGRAFDDHYILEEHMDLFVVDNTPAGLLEKLALFHFPQNTERWLNPEK